MVSEQDSRNLYLRLHCDIRYRLEQVGLSARDTSQILALDSSYTRLALVLEV
jgi:hypothetical protein